MPKMTAFQTMQAFLQSLPATDRSFVRAQLILKLPVDPDLMLPTDEDDALLAAVQKAIEEIANDLRRSSRRPATVAGNATTTGGFSALKKPNS